MLAAVDDQGVAGEARRPLDEAQGAHEVVRRHPDAQGIGCVVAGKDGVGLAGVIAAIRQRIGDTPCYLTLDIDCLDPAFAPGTGTPEVGGLSSREGLALLRGLSGLNVIGADVVEVAPQYDPTSNTAQLGAQILFEEFALMTLGRPQ